MTPTHPHGPPADLSICSHCDELVSFGFAESHSNRCPLFGGHSDERCGTCRQWYRPPKGWSGDACPRCSGKADPGPRSKPLPHRRRDMYVWGKNGLERAR